ncbi:hypothetical protein HAV38_04480 [Glaciimonas immobilis]|nr:hypothetical protein HAV38_04480 [Glaciimonas immobilis]
MGGFAGGVLALCIVAIIEVPENKDGDKTIAQHTAAIAPNDGSLMKELAPQPVASILSVTVIQLSKDYEVNEVAADQKYKGKKLRVSGSVQSIDKDMFDNIVVRLKATNEFMAAVANLGSEHEALAASLLKGKKVTWHCVGGGLLVGSAVLNDCVPI